MYYLKKTITVSGAHKLNLYYDSPCKNIHGHNWKIIVYCKREELNNEGMIIDFCKIKELINGTFDHKEINIGKNPTAENIARYIQENIPFCYRVDVEETEGNTASYEI